MRVGGVGLSRGMIDLFAKSCRPAEADRNDILTSYNKNVESM